ncbi:MAG: protein translocase subunit SecD [Sphaerochaetaceae bacterium]|nr:protein translocase subunit SecD [Sphaerochaetaceae bacterium]MDC7238501.1 protein translocase subunit SecD [Sphaerochaetaceae bacterium]MDC7242702.1 protein translocase subunit SecD [Sphaerochaetaceae bacterium]MDC7250666.1 protein translocase subunit SecD [Sphaerochaetaceae bacterium]
MKKRDRLIIVLLVLLMCGYFLYPTIKWYTIVPQETKDLASGSNEQIREYARGQATRELKAIKSLVTSNPSSDVPAEYSYLKSIAKDNYKDMSKDTPSSWTIESLCAGFYNEQAMFDAIEKHYRSSLLEVKNLSDSVLQLGLDLRGGMSILLDADVDSYNEKAGKTASASEVNALVLQDIEILENRIDQFGVSEPEIRLQGNDQILVEIPGAADPERVNSFLQGKGSLLFQIVDQSLTTELNTYFEENPSEVYTDGGEIKQPDFLPAGKIAAGYYVKDSYGIDELQSFVVLDSEIGLDGIHLESAQTGTNSITAQPVVNFHLDASGGDAFYKFTSTHVGDSMAVVMDGKVKSVATINEAIRQDVQISGFSQEEASDLAIVLRTAALPIELVVSSQQAVGATLGEDAVAAGLKAIALGLALVVVFMFIYYGLSGLVANLALVLNLVIMLAVLSAFKFTLTLTSIAGLILTLGMAVDANVIIFERIKEELRFGKSSQVSVKTGFGKAFWTIMDANITTIIAALVLSQLGSSSVKGFANTLAIGIVSSLFTALFVSHLIFDTAITDREGAKLHITWRKK